MRITITIAIAAMAATLTPPPLSSMFTSSHITPSLLSHTAQGGVCHYTLRTNTVPEALQTKGMSTFSQKFSATCQPLSVNFTQSYMSLFFCARSDE